MAFLWKHPQSKYWIARFYDLQGKRRNRSTRVLAREAKRKEAERIAAAFEDTANKKRTARQVRDVIASLHREAAGMELSRFAIRAKAA